MNIKLPINIHNRFDIVVKDVKSGEVVQRGYAENIVLNNYFNFAQLGAGSSNYIPYYIHFGDGTGEITPTRTTLFNRIDSKLKEEVETVYNQVPTTSYATYKIVLLSTEYVGSFISEVGLGISLSSTIFTHTLIKDSEGNQLILGPKTDTQQIDIYATVFFQPNFENGITFNQLTTNPNTNAKNIRNVLLSAFTFRSSDYPLLYTEAASLSGYKTRLLINGSVDAGYIHRVGNPVNGVITLKTILVEPLNYIGKIKTVKLSYSITTSTDYPADAFNMELETLAENESTIWSGHGFDKEPIGVGDGSQVVFNLTWDEVWMEKPKAVYVDGVLKSSGVTWDAGTITFDIAPAIDAVITADYWVKYMPKDDKHRADFKFEIVYGEGAPQ